MIRRFLAALRWDATLQFRNGFYWVGAFVAAFFIGLISLLPENLSLDLALVVPAVVMMNLMITTFYFIAALVLLEKSEGTLAGLLASPLRDTEYFAAKIASLTFLAVAETIVIVVVAFGTGFRPLPMFGGMLLLSGFYVLAGFVTIARFDSINEYLISSGLVVAVLALPLLHHFGLFNNAVFYAHPVQPALVLMRSAYAPSEGWQVAYGVLGSLLWLALGFGWARGAFHRFVIRAAGS